MRLELSEMTAKVLKWIFCIDSLSNVKHGPRKSRLRQFSKLLAISKTLDMNCSSNHGRM